VVAISFLVGLGLGLVALFPDISNFYHQHSAFEDFMAVLTTGSGLGMARVSTMPGTAEFSVGVRKRRAVVLPEFD